MRKKPGPEIAFWITFIIILLICMIWFVQTAKGEDLISDEEIDMLAKTVWGEARGLDEYEQSLVVWCILNRFDNGKFGSSVKEIITKPYQFQGYKESFPIDEDILRLCKDVVYRWENSLEGRTLPEEYLYFYGDGKHNYYTTEYQGNTKYDFSLPNPYEGERGCYYGRENSGRKDRGIKNRHRGISRSYIDVLYGTSFKRDFARRCIEHD